MPEKQNKQRALDAAVALDAYRKLGTCGDDMDTGIGDLITDLYHLANAHGLEVEKIADRAWRYFDTEVSDWQEGDPIEEGE